MNDFLIIAFAGFSGAGKSTLARFVANSLGLEFIEHQKLVHSIAISKGFERSRYWLAEVGVEEFIRESEDEMLVRIDAHKENGVVLDVVYNQEMLDKIRNKFPESKLLLISISTESGTRGERISGRMGGVSGKEGVKEREFRDGFLRDAGMESALKTTDIEVMNNGNLEKTQEELLLKLKDKI